MAVQQQLKRLKRSVSEWNQWRLGRSSLFRADLSGVDLSHVDLSDADLSGATLTNANLSGATLSGADLSGADLSRSDLSRSDLRGANLNAADLSEAVLVVADLFVANLSGAILDGADFSEAVMGGTSLGDLDLRHVKGLETVRHRLPSHLTINTLYLSGGEIPEAFVRGTGAPDTFVEYMRSLVARPIEYYTCFLSYTSRDQAFAERLYTDLQHKGVRCWFAPHELKPGDYYRDRIDESIRDSDKLVLILSSYSIKSKWVQDEVEKALKREEMMEPTRQLLFPIRLDDTVMTSGQRWISSLRFLRHIGDFSGWKDHDTYQEKLEGLLHDLRAETMKS